MQRGEKQETCARIFFILQNRSKHLAAAGVKFPKSSDLSHSGDKGIHQYLNLGKMKFMKKNSRDKSQCCFKVMKQAGVFVSC